MFTVSRPFQVNRLNLTGELHWTAQLFNAVLMDISCGYSLNVPKFTTIWLMWQASERSHFYWRRGPIIVYYGKMMVWVGLCLVHYNEETTDTHHQPVHKQPPAGTRLQAGLQHRTSKTRLTQIANIKDSITILHIADFMTPCRNNYKLMPVALFSD